MGGAVSRPTGPGPGPAARVTALLLGVVALVLTTASCSSTDDDADTVGSQATASGGDLVAAFSYDVDQQVTGGTSCPAVGVTFTDESEGDPTGWRWEFGDGSTSTEQDPERSIAPENGEEVTLTVTRGGESDTVTEEVTFGVC